jgi:hypothetical protein
VRGCFDFGIAKVGIKFKPPNFFDKNFQKTAFLVKKSLDLIEKTLVFLGWIRSKR